MLQLFCWNVIIAASVITWVRLVNNYDDGILIYYYYYFFLSYHRFG